MWEREITDFSSGSSKSKELKHYSWLHISSLLSFPTSLFNCILFCTKYLEEGVGCSIFYVRCLVLFVRHWESESTRLSVIQNSCKQYLQNKEHYICDHTITSLRFKVSKHIFLKVNDIMLQKKNVLFNFIIFFFIK